MQALWIIQSPMQIESGEIQILKQKEVSREYLNYAASD